MKNFEFANVRMYVKYELIVNQSSVSPSSLSVSFYRN